MTELLMRNLKVFFRDRANVFFSLLSCTVLSVISSSSMVCLLVTFFKSQNAFGTASTIIGTLIGFITGTYMP